MEIATKNLSRSFLAAACAVSLGTVLLTAPPAWASGVQRNATTGVMFRQVFRMKAGVNYAFTTRNLSPNSDTIIHVVSFPEGQFIAGNDDTLTINPDTGEQITQPYSTAAVLAASTDRTVYLIVRAKPGTPDGTADFRIVGTTGLTTVVKDSTTNVVFSAGFVKNVPSLAAGTHITTIEEPIGTVDTMLMVFANNNPVATLGFDDDDGIDFMSFVRLGTACSANCQIVVGTPNPSIHIGFLDVSFPPGPVGLIWDEKLEASGQDPDLDGISSELENLIFTNPLSRDSDADGIFDGMELYGGIIKTNARNPAVPGTGQNGSLLKFPKYGANPAAPDVFVEIDWVPACPASDPACSPLALNLALRPDGKRIATAAASNILNQAAGSMNGAVRAHFDVGVPTTAGDVVAKTNVTFGTWGGANRLTDGQTTFVKNNTTGTYTATIAPDTFLGFEIDQDCFTGVSPARVGTFNHQVITDDPTNGRYPELPGTIFESAACSFVHVGDGSIAHEIGHNYNLRHGGFPSAADGKFNCKMNYASIMSYPNQGTNAFGPGYSFARFQSRTLNGIAMDEAAGLGISPFTEAPILDVFDTGALARGFVNRVTGGIDWNMDGIVQGGSVRAPTNWANTTCGAPYLRPNWNVLPSGNRVAFPIQTVAEASASSPQLYARADSNVSMVAIGAGNAGGCAQAGFGSCTSWTWTKVPVRNGITSSLAVAGPLIVYRSGGTLAYLRRIVAATLPTFQESTIGAVPAAGDPAAIEVNGRVKVFYLDANGTLFGSEYDEATNDWTVASERWEDGTAIHSGIGIAAVHGAVRPAGQGLFAAIPNKDKAAAGTPNQLPVEFATLNSVMDTVVVTVPTHTAFIKGSPITVPAYTYSYSVIRDRWQRFGLAAGAVVQSGKPGLAYVPFDVASPNDGRFYLTNVPGGNGFQAQTARIMFTQGNDTTPGAAARALAWMPNQQTLFADDENQALSLNNGVVLARFGQSLAAATFGASSVGASYFPAADGVINVIARDYDDDALVRHNLACSVHGDSCDGSP